MFFIPLFLPICDVDSGLDRGEGAEYPCSAVHHAYSPVGGRDALEARGHG